MTTAELYETPSALATPPPTFNPWVAFLSTQPRLGRIRLVVPTTQPALAPDRVDAATESADAIEEELIAWLIGDSVDWDAVERGDAWSD
jgi:hypothetical protein